MTEPPGDSWTRLSDAFEEARSLSSEGREDLVSRLRRDDAALASDLESLLSGLDTAKDFLEPPARDGVAANLEGARIGGCQVVRRLGQGGMGAVYEAVQEPIGRRVAIKVMRATFAGSDERQRFEYEAHWLGQLRHPGVAQVFAVGEHRDSGLGLAFPYCIMELVPDAQTIVAYARGRRLDLRATIGLFLQVCDAVQHAHGRGIIHRDLKPGNVLVDSAGQPKLIDFGVARHADHATPRPFETHPGALVGTIGYMSPEQLAGTQDAIDIRTDVWALGVILFELLTGELPIPVASLSFVEALARLRGNDPRPPSTLRSDLRGDLEVVMLKALARNPEDRYASVAAFADDLRRFLRDEPVLARRPTLVQSLRLFARRHAAAVLTVAIVGTVLVAATVVSLVFAFKTEEARMDEAERAREAERERAAAQALVDHGREFANWMIFDFQNRILALDGATSAKRELSAALVSYLEGLSRLKGSDRAIALEIARARTQLGSLSGHASRGGGGDTEAALAHYRQALAALDTIVPRNGDHAADAQAALLRFRMAEVLVATDPAASFALLGEARSTLERLRTTKPDDLKVDALLADLLWFTGDLHDRSGNADLAKQVRDVALEVLDRIFARDPKALQGDATVSRNLFDLRVKYADLLMRLGRIDDARRTGEVLVAEAGSPADATSLRARNDVGIASRTLGAIATSQGDHVIAARSYERAATVFQEIFGANPENLSYVELAVRCLFGHAKALRSTGDHAAAVEASQRAIELHGGHLAKRWTSILDRRMVLGMWILLVESAVDAGNVAVAAQAWRAASAAADEVIESPGSDADDRRFAAMIARRGGLFAEKRAGESSDPDQSLALLREARDAYAKALKTYRALTELPGAAEGGRANVLKLSDEVERLDKRLAESRPARN